MNYWLMKSEPNVYSINDLKEDKTNIWDGVRNYQARNYLRQMEVGDLAFFYHSNAKPPAIVGMMKIIETNINDPTQFDPNSKYYDPTSSENKPRWQTVRVEFLSIFPEIITLEKLKQTFTDDQLLVVKKGCRLSVMPVQTKIAQQILMMIPLNPP